MLQIVQLVDYVIPFFRNKKSVMSTLQRKVVSVHQSIYFQCDVHKIAETSTYFAQSLLKLTQKNLFYSLTRLSKDFGIEKLTLLSFKHGYQPMAIITKWTNNVQYIGQSQAKSIHRLINQLGWLTGQYLAILK